MHRAHGRVRVMRLRRPTRAGAELATHSAPFGAEATEFVPDNADLGIVTIGHGHPPVSAVRSDSHAPPPVIATPLRHNALRGGVMAGGDLLALLVVVAWFVPDLVEWWVPAFAVGVLGLSAFR